MTNSDISTEQIRFRKEPINRLFALKFLFVLCVIPLSQREVLTLCVCVCFSCIPCLIIHLGVRSVYFIRVECLTRSQPRARLCDSLISEGGSSDRSHFPLLLQTSDDRLLSSCFA